MPQKTKLLTQRPIHYTPDTHIKKRNLVFVDLEFSGLEPKHEMIQIGCVVVSQPDLKILKEWSQRIKPSRIRNADPNALKIIGYSKEKWRDAVPLKQALTEFNEVAKGGVLIGYNVAWDFLFLKKAYAEATMKPLFHWQVLDVLSMLFHDLYRTKMNGFRMKEVVDFFHMRDDQWHDALVDARATYVIFKKLIQYNHTHRKKKHI